MTSIVYQYLATICGNIATIVFGITVSWVSPIMPVLFSDENILPSGPISKDQAAWINSVMCLGAFAGNLVFGTLVDRIGRKWSLFFLAIPNAISFCLILVAQDADYLMAARAIGGIAGGGLFVVLPIYINEISEDR
ncbi:TRET1 [Sergentomyia squamirostris]